MENPNNSSQELYAWGSAEFDQFDAGEDRFESRKPVLINYFVQKSICISKIACGAQHSLLLSSAGQVFSMGGNDDGALGRTGPEKTPGLVELPFKADLISCGDSHSVAANGANGIVYNWGVYLNAVSGKMSKPIVIPEQVGELEFHKRSIQKLISGGNHTMVLSQKKIFCWGDVDTCVLGRTTLARRKFSSALKVGGLGYRNVVDIFAGANHCFMIQEKKKRQTGTVDRLLFGWGLNNFGQLGIGESDNTFKAVELPEMRNKPIKNIVGGEYHTLILMENGEVFGCGKTSDHQLGPLNMDQLRSYGFVKEDGRVQESISKPIKLDLEHPIKQVYAANNYSYGVQNDDFIRTWGLGFSYVLANGREEEVREPWTISREKFLKAPVGTIALGSNHVMFTKANAYWDSAPLDADISRRNETNRKRKMSQRSTQAFTSQKVEKVIKEVDGTEAPAKNVLSQISLETNTEALKLQPEDIGLDEEELPASKKQPEPQATL